MTSPAKAALAIVVGVALGTAAAIARVPGWQVRAWLVSAR
jgi:hypothetical protein